QTSVIVGAHLPDGRETISYRFRTCFARPASLFFDYREFWRGTSQLRANGTIWATPDRVEQWTSIQPERESRTELWTAISRFAGVSGGTVCWIPFLVLDGSGRRSNLPDPDTARISGEAPHEGRECFVIEGRSGRSGRLV